MAEQKKRSLIDELADRVGEALDDLGQLFQPKREPARIPVPVRRKQPLPQRRRR
ncbi:MAG: hypothetical protein AAF125_15330 [Chloroflexota bacterium]